MSKEPIIRAAQPPLRPCSPGRVTRPRSSTSDVGPPALRSASAEELGFQSLRLGPPLDFLPQVMRQNWRQRVFQDFASGCSGWRGVAAPGVSSACVAAKALRGNRATCCVATRASDRLHRCVLRWAICFYYSRCCGAPIVQALVALRARLPQRRKKHPNASRPETGCRLKGMRPPPPELELFAAPAGLVPAARHIRRRPLGPCAPSTPPTSLGSSSQGSFRCWWLPAVLVHNILLVTFQWGSHPRLRHLGEPVRDGVGVIMPDARVQPGQADSK